jgi:hypothetical protein
MFQATKANKDQTRDLVHTINKHLDATPVPDTRLDSTFEKWWPDLEKTLTTLPPPSETPPRYPDTREMVAEILELTRAMAPELLKMRDEMATTHHLKELFAPSLDEPSKHSAGKAALLGHILSGVDGIGSAYGVVPGIREAPPSESPAKPSRIAASFRRARRTDKK